VRKAQIEMMGLVVVVILVTLGLFFSIALQPQPETKENVEVYTDEKLAGNFLITLLETDVPGYNLKVRNVAVDCVRKERGNDKYRLHGKDSCEAFGNITQHVLNHTFERWGQGYSFNYTYDPGDGKEALVELGEPCTGERAGAGVQYISLFGVAPGKASLSLHVCR